MAVNLSCRTEIAVHTPLLACIKAVTIGCMEVTGQRGMVCQQKFSAVASWRWPCRDAALHRREDRKRKRDEEKAAEKEKEKLKKVKEEPEKEKEGAAKAEPDAQQNGTSGGMAKEDSLGQAQVKTEHIKAETASAAAFEAGGVPNGDKVRSCHFPGGLRLNCTCKPRAWLTCQIKEKTLQILDTSFEWDDWLCRGPMLWQQVTVCQLLPCRQVIQRGTRPRTLVKIQ